MLRIFLFLHILFLIFPCFSLGSEPFGIIFPENSQIIYEDKPLELNKIKAFATCFLSQLSAEETLNFYKEALIKDGWLCKDFPYQTTTGVFTKEDRFFYVLTTDNLKKSGCQVYLVNSVGDLAICKTLKTYLFQEEISPDTPGKDFQDIPRYPGSKRRISAFAGPEGQFLLYEVSAPVQEVANFYRQMLKAQAWEEELDNDVSKIPGLDSETKDNLAVLFFHNKAQEELWIQIMALTEKMAPPLSTYAKDNDSASGLNTGIFKKGFSRTLIIIGRDIQEILGVSPLE